MTEVSRVYSPEELLNKHRITGIVPGKLGRQYALCPMCSHQRTGANQKSKCLAVNFDNDGFRFFCNHCGEDPGGMKGGEVYAPRRPGSSTGYQPAPGSISSRAMPKRNGYAALHASSRKHWGQR